MVVALAVPTSAFELSHETFNHGRQIALYSTGIRVLNQYTNGDVVSGTKVTTWEETGASTQFWEFASVAGGKTVAVPWSNYSVSINISWNVNTPELNVFSVAANNLSDAAFARENIDASYKTRTFTRQPFNISINPSASYGKRYVYVTAERTAVLDSVGLSKIVRWNPVYKTAFYDCDDKEVLRP